MRKIIYLLLTGIVFFLSALYDEESVRFLLIFLLLLPLVLLVSLLFIRAGVRVEMKVRQDQIQKGDSWKVELRIRNRSRIPVPVVRIRLSYTEMQTGEREEITFLGSAERHGTTKIVGKRQEKYCGNVRICLESVQVFDLLGLFAARIPVQGQVEIKILPTLYLTEVMTKPVVQPVESDFCEYDLSRPGNDVSEIFQIREYQAGDTLHRIHWKLSAREDDILVKDYSYPLGYRACLYLDFFIPRTEKNLRRKADGLIQLGMALSFSMFLCRCPHFLVWRNPDGHLSRYGIRTEEHLYEVMEAVMLATILDEENPWEAQYRRQFADEIPQVRILVNHRLEVWKKDQMLMCFHADAMEKELETFRLEI